MNRFPASILFSAVVSAVMLCACSSDGNVGFGAGVNGIRVNPPPGTTPDPAPTTTPVAGTSADAGIGAGSISLSRTGVTVTTPSLSTNAASNGSVSINGDPLLSTGNLVQPVVGLLTDTVGMSPLSSGSSANVNIKSNSQTGQPSLLSNGLAPITDIAASVSGSANPLSAGNGNVIGNVVNGTSAIANSALSTTAAIVGNTPLLGSSTSPSAQTLGNVLTIGTTTNNGAAVSLGDRQLLPLNVK